MVTAGQPSRNRLYIAGSIGGSSIAPPVHNFIAKQMGKAWDMQFLHRDTVQSVVHAFRRPDFAGGSVTMPWKTSIISYLDETDDIVLLTGACNTVYLTPNGKIRGTNTDWLGIKTALDKATRRRDGACGMIYGAGGTSRAALYTLIMEFGLKTVYVVNRDESEVSSLMGDASKYAGKAEFRLIHVKTVQQAEGLPVPTYVISTVPDIEPRTAREIEANAILREFLFQGKCGDGVLLDMCYHPRITRNLQLGIELGWATVDGVQVLAHLFKIQWKLWTGQVFSDAIEEQAVALLEASAQADMSVTPQSRL